MHRLDRRFNLPQGRVTFTPRARRDYTTTRDGGHVDPAQCRARRRSSRL